MFSKDHNREEYNGVVYYKGQYLKVKTEYPNPVFSGKIVKVDNFFDLDHYIGRGGGIPVKTIEDDYKEETIPFEFLEILSTDVVNRDWKPKKRRYMPRLFKWFFYIMILMLMWRFVQNVDYIVVFFAKLLLGGI